MHSQCTLKALLTHSKCTPNALLCTFFIIVKETLKRHSEHQPKLFWLNLDKWLKVRMIWLANQSKCLCFLSWIWLVNFWVLGWTDFFIGNVIERPGRAENFKERSFLNSDWFFTQSSDWWLNWSIRKQENKTAKARMAARIERIEKHYIDCKRND